MQPNEAGHLYPLPSTVYPPLGVTKRKTTMSDLQTGRNNPMNTMTHRGYAARIDYSDEDGCFVGHIAGINDVVGFHGESVEELRSAFVESVEDYLETCEKLNRPPQKPYSGNLMLRIPPQVHAAIATAAEVSGKSINQWASDTLADVLDSDAR